MIEGVDLYEGNDFSSAASVDFIIIKATQGITFTDSTFAERWDRLAAMGKVRGAYHYPNIYNPPQSDFAHFESVLGPVLRPGDLVVLDFEGDTDTHTWAERIAWKNAFLSLAKQRWPNNRAGVYCDLDWWNHSDDNPGDFLWIADYGVKGSPRVACSWTFQQYGIVGNTDRDVFPGTLAQLQTWANVQPLPPPNQEATMPSFFTGEVKPGFLTDANGVVTKPANATILLTPPPGGGALLWGSGYLSLGSDFGTANIRVAVHNGQFWGPVETVVVQDNEPRLLVMQLPANAGKISLGRVPTSPTDTDDGVPVAWLVELGG